ncbi:response regulator transcription factor [Thiobacillus sp.]|uniref:response regulator transcription factor n=1 Tax=Thiobacillus sp. TaxID=924 RepID=UPI00286D87AE|nr:response regulator transcription factor [Thiobacillus sp.]
MNTTEVFARPSVLLVDDDQELLDMLRDYLERDGFAVRCEYDGLSGADAALSGRYDIAVLDVMMPGLDGFQTLARVRTASTMPIIMLTARGDDADRIAGLEHGADDYVPKPCSPRELAARLRVILKRLQKQEASDTQEAQPLIAGTLKLWPTLRRAEDNGTPMELTSTEFGLLEVLARHVGHPVSKADLSTEAIGRPLTRFDRSIDVHIHSIRNKLKPLSDGRSRIQTVIRKGYQLISG